MKPSNPYSSQQTQYHQFTRIFNLPPLQLKLQIRYIESENRSEILPDFLITEDLSRKTGAKVLLRWLLAEPKPKQAEEQDGVLYQEILINQTDRFSEKLDGPFFEQIANEFNHITNFTNKTYLLFKLFPLEPPRQTTRLSWWEGHIVCTEYENGKWKLSRKEIVLWNEIYDHVLMQGIVKISNGH